MLLFKILLNCYCQFVNISMSRKQGTFYVLMLFSYYIFCHGPHLICDNIRASLNITKYINDIYTYFMKVLDQRTNLQTVQNELDQKNILGLYQLLTMGSFVRHGRHDRRTRTLFMKIVYSVQMALCQRQRTIVERLVEKTTHFAILSIPTSLGDIVHYASAMVS